MRLSTNSVLLAIYSVLVTGLFVVVADRTPAEQQCIKATKRACVWVLKPGDHYGNAYIVHRCKAPGSRCVYNSTCEVNHVSRDIYHCQAKPQYSNQNEAGTMKTRKRKWKHVKPEPRSAQAHARARRSADDTKAKQTEQTTNEDKLPITFREIMARHRAYNADAFNGGTYILNKVLSGQSSVNKNNPLPVMKGAS